MEFTGWTPEDFDLFAIPDFAGRIGALRERVRPKLDALGADLTAKVEALTELPTHAHVAQHMRRRVNPPEETWVAFARDRKGYKRWTHYRIAVSGAGVRVTVFVEDDADDKPRFGERLAAGADDFAAALGPHTGVRWFTLEGEATASFLAQTGAALQRLKTLKFQAGAPLPREDALRMTPAQFEEWVMKQMALLKPLYLAGAGDSD